MNGVLNIHKPSGMTSHDVVQAVRRVVKEKRVGHTGTLDPLASGVLVLCVGKATRIARYLEAGEKEYRAVLRLGVTTDTLDAEGRVVEKRSYIPPERSQVIAAIQGFIGPIMQRPPAYSAVKVGGVRSYRLARQGKAVLMNPRSVTISAIELVAYEDPFITINVKCSKGVYIRTLCADLGEVLGPGGHLTSLIRTRSGRFSIDQAIMLDELAARSAGDSPEKFLISIDEALADFPALTVHNNDASKIIHGNRISIYGKYDEGRISQVRIHDSSGRLLALARTNGGKIRPEIVFS